MQILIVVILLLVTTNISFIVLYYKKKNLPGSGKMTADNADITRSWQVELELQNYRLKLEQLVEEKTKNIEQANQELQALNEEIDTSNEELQAINEELNATNEELEFSNNALSKEVEEHKKTQAEKAIIEEKLNQFISQSSEAIIIINDKGIVEDWNDTMVQITGITKENALGKFMWDVTYMMANDPDKAEFVRDSFKSNTLQFFEEVKQGNRKVQGTESQIRHHDSSHRYIRTTLFPIDTCNGYYGGVIISDITQKKANEAQLEKYRNELEKLLEQGTERLEQLSVRFNEVYTNSSDAITFMDILDEGNAVKVFDMNPASKRLFKISDEQLVKGVYIEELLPEIKIESFKQHILPKLLSGIPVTFTEDRDTGNGIWNSTVYPIKDETGKIYRIAAFSKNVTAELEREKTSAILKSAIESWPYEFWVSNKDGVCILQNTTSLRIWGNRIGKKLTDINVPEAAKQKTLEDESKALQGIPSCTELKFETPEGPRYVLVYTNPIFVKNEITGFLGIIADITHQKKIEIALKESEKRLSQLLSSVTDYKFTVELVNGEMVNSLHSEGCLSVTGYSPADLKNNRFLWFKMAHEDDKELIKEWSENVNKGIEVEPFEHRIIHKNGETIWVSNTTVLKKDSQGKLVGFDGLVSDITKRKNAELALRESEERFRYIARLSKNLVYDYDLKSNKIQWDGAIEEITGFTPDEYKNTDFNRWTEMIHSDDRETALALFQESLANLKPYQAQYRYKNKYNQFRWIEEDSHIIVAPDNTPVKYLGVMKDITERKESEEKIRISEEKYRLLAENINDIIWKFNINTLRYTYFSPSIFKLTGYTVEEAMELTLDQIIMPDSLIELEVALPEWITQYNNGVQGSKNRTFEYQIRHKNGQPLWVEINATFITEPTGDIKEVIATSRSIEERKASEIALRKSEERYDLVTELSGYVVYDYDIINRKIVWAGAVEKVLGYSISELKEKSIEELMNLFYPDDLNNMMTKHDTERNTIQPSTSQYRYLTKNKGYIWIETHAFLFTDDQNRQYRWLGIMRDITEQLRIQSLIKESEEKLKTIFNTTKDGIVLLNKEMEIFDINTPALNHSGYSREELVGKNVLGFLIKNGPSAIAQHILSIWDKDVIDNFETDIIIKNDGSFPVEISATALNIDKQEMLLLMIRDISERKYLEKQLLHSVINTEEKERIHFSQDLHDGLGPLLSAAKMYTEWLAEPEPGVDPKVIIQDIKKLLEESTRTVKDISFKLSPHILQNYGIVEALNAYAEKAEKSSKIHIAVNAVNVGRFDEILEIITYRVMCECINNSMKHAKASNIMVSLKMEDNFLNIDFSDDGIGFDVNTVSKNHKGIGLLNIQSRLKSINGQFSLHSEIGHGTKISINVPLQA